MNRKVKTGGWTLGIIVWSLSAFFQMRFSRYSLVVLQQDRDFKLFTKLKRKEHDA